MPDAGTVVLRDLSELETGAQLFPLVADGEFSEALVYRLNVVTMHAAAVEWA